MEGRYKRGPGEMKRSFALVELFIVIGIIAVLAGLLLPSLGTDKEKARQAICINNMRQIATAFMVYLNDWEGRFPNYGMFPWQGWHVTLNNEYIKDERVFFCPTFKYNSFDFTGNHIGYGYNNQWIGGARTGGVARKIYEITNPVNIILAGDSDGDRGAGGIGNNRQNIQSYIDNPPGGDDDQHISNRHSGGSFIAFCDGHVKWMEKDKTSQDVSLWNRIR